MGGKFRSFSWVENWRPLFEAIIKNLLIRLEFEDPFWLLHFEDEGISSLSSGPQI